MANNVITSELNWIDSSQLETIPTSSGAYILKIFINSRVQIKLAKTGEVRFLPGEYFYAGSAHGPGGIRSRVRRHFSKDKKIHWHVDHLTISAKNIMAFVTTQHTECELVNMMLETSMFKHVTKGFGSSDCKTCKSHLLQRQSEE